MPSNLEHWSVWYSKVNDQIYVCSVNRLTVRIFDQEQVRRFKLVYLGEL